MEGTVRSEGRGAKFWLIIVLIALGFLLVAVNFQKVTIDFVFGPRPRLRPASRSRP